MRVRITSGEFGGRFIKTLPTLRPMMEMARKAMFDILGNKIVDAHFLDLYAGSGAAGIEALSRGADRVTFVEKDQNHYRLIKANLSSLGISDQASVRMVDADIFVEANPYPFDIVFAAPWYKDIADLSIKGWEKLVAPEGILVIEHHKNDAAPTNEYLKQIRTEHYGDTALTFYTG